MIRFRNQDEPEPSEDGVAAPRQAERSKRSSGDAEDAGSAPTRSERVTTARAATTPPAHVPRLDAPVETARTSDQPDAQGSDAGPPPPPKKQRGRFRWRRVFVALLLLMLVTLSVAFYLTRKPPVAWTRYEAYITETTPDERAEVIADIIARLEAALLLDDTHGSGLGLALRDLQDHDTPTPGDTDAEHAFAGMTPLQIAEIPFDRTTRIKLTNEELASLSAQWFDNWCAQRGFVPPEGMKPPIVVAIDGKLRLGFEMALDGWRQTFGGVVNLRFRDDGVAEGSVREFTVGSLPVPISMVGQTLRDDIGEERANKAGEWIAKLDHFEFRPVLELEYRRRARVTGLELHPDDTVTLTLRVQDHRTYKQHNVQLAEGLTTPEGSLVDPLAAPGETGIADVPTLYE